MAEQPSQPYRNFTLLELSHINQADFESAQRDYEQFGETGLRTVQKFVQEKIEFGKRVIDSETKPGDLVLIESPEPVIFEQFLKNFGITDIHNHPKRELVKLRWEMFLRENYNIYPILANYERSKGRKVETLEYGATGNKSRLTAAATRLREFTPEKAKRIYQMLTVKRHTGIEKKIESKKPQLVITASGHAAQLEETLKPRKTIYQNPLARSAFSGNLLFLAKQKIAREEYLREKKEHRANAIAQLRKRQTRAPHTRRKK